MVLNDVTGELSKKSPYIESRVELSRDGRYVIHTTTIKHIRPVSYYKAVLSMEV